MTKETYVNVRKNNFTMVSNSLLNDKAVTLQAKGLLSIFVSNDTDKFTVNMKEIITRSKNGRDAHYKVIDELIKHGYFARVEIREGGKFTEMKYIFSDDKADVTEALRMYASDETAIINPDKKKKPVDNSPLPESQDTVKEEKKPLPDIQDTEIQDTDFPYTVFQDNNNTKGNNTNINNTNINNINQSSSLPKVESNTNDHLYWMNSEQLDHMYEMKSMPINVLQVISHNLNRLTDLSLSPIDILSFYQSSENTVSPKDFAELLNKSLKKDIKNFSGYMKKAIKNWYEEYQGNVMPNAGEEEETIESAGIDKDKLPEYLKYDFIGQ